MPLPIEDLRGRMAMGRELIIRRFSRDRPTPVSRARLIGSKGRFRLRGRKVSRELQVVNKVKYYSNARIFWINDQEIQIQERKLGIPGVWLWTY